jgi:hypothetical protein
VYSSWYRHQGWTKFINGCHLPSDFAANIKQLPHHATWLLDHLRRHGASVPSTMAPWTQAKLEEAKSHGFHKSAKDHLDFLQEEILSMMQKGQWILPPTSSSRTYPTYASVRLAWYPSATLALAS